MEETQRYVQILIESLRKKKEVLAVLLMLNEEQAQIVKEGQDLQAFDQVMTRKAEQIDILNKLDAGFDVVYNRVKSELTGNPAKYKDEIHEIQGLIKELTDASVKIEAGEQRNRLAVENYFVSNRKAVQETKRSVSVATNYYKSMTGTQYVDPQMINFKQ